MKHVELNRNKYLILLADDLALMFGEKFIEIIQGCIRRTLNRDMV